MATEIDDDTLQRYYDGELSPSQERVLRAAVESDPKAKARLAELSRLSELFREASGQMAAGLDSDALFAGIEADIRRQGRLGFGERLRVLTTEWTEHKKAVVVPLFATAAVAAAAVIMFALPNQTNGPAVAGKAKTAEDRALSNESAAPNQATAQVAEAIHGSEVEAVDFGSSTGTVFKIDSQGIATAVVWIADEDEENTP